jgi:hypothetical protein
VLQAIRHRAESLRVVLEHAIVDARRDARTVAFDRFAVELALLTKELRRHGITADFDTRAVTYDAHDQVRAHSAASSFVAAWSAAMTGAVVLAGRREASPLPLLRKGADGQSYRLARIAITEVAQAYSQEHDEGIGYALKPHKSARWFPAVFRRWDAQNDRRTCQTCREHDGELALPLVGGFQNGDMPGDVHANCRCIDTLAFLPAMLPAAASEGHYVGTDLDETG